MLKLKNISLKYDEQLVVSGELSINEGEITLITGESGSGKSSLLNMIGLILDKVEKQCEYYINNEKIDLNNDSMKRLLQREYISYVFQDYNLFDTLSIEDNFKTMFDMVSLEYNESKVNEYLELVGLKDIFKKKIKNLSGGQRQRLAIALALVKDPQLVLLDEPTANLDEENSIKVVEILEKLKQQGKMVVVSSHHPELYPADVTYSIENKSLQRQGNEYKETKGKEIVYGGINSKFNLKYGLRKFFSGSTINAVLVVMLGLVIGFVSFNNINVDQATGRQEEQLNQIAGTDILVMNFCPVPRGEDLVMYDSLSSNDGISKEQFDKIKAIKNVENVYPYHFFSYQLRDDINVANISNSKKMCLYVYDENGNEIKSFNVYDDYTNGEKFQQQHSVALTSWDEYNDELKRILYDKSIDGGVYISKTLYDYIGIEDIIGKTLKFNIAVPFAYTKGIYGSSNENDSYQDEIIPIPRCVTDNIEVKVKGVLDIDDNVQYYDHGDVFHVYMNNVQLDELIEEMTQDKEAMYEQFLDDNEGNLLFDREDNLYHMGYWCNTLIVRVNDYKNVEEVNKQIKLISENFGTKTKAMELESLKKLEKQYKTQGTDFPILLTGMLVILVCVVYYYRVKKNKREYALLKANGITDIEKSLFYELLTLGVSEYAVSLLVIIGSIIYYNYIISIGLTITISVIINPIFTILLSVAVPYILVRQMIKKINVSILVRSS